MKLKNLIKLTFISLLLFVIGVQSSQAQTPTLANYTSYPAFLSAAVKPNILLILDNSSSMLRCAYADTGNTSCEGTGSPSIEYLAATSYVGYFDQTKCYIYASSKFSETTGSSGSCSNAWDGNFLNWVSMRRIDVTKSVLIGGECASVRASDNSCSTLTGQSNFTNNLCCETYYKKFNLNGLTPSTYTNERCINISGGDFIVGGSASCGSSGDTFNIKVDRTTPLKGVIQDVWNSAKIALMMFDGEDGGEITSGFGSTEVAMVNSINNMNAPSYSPLAEALFEGARYFAQIAPMTAGHYSLGGANDPYCFADLTPISGETGCVNNPTGRWVECCKNFIIVFTDGDPTRDDDTIPASLKTYANSVAGASSETFDDVAYWAHTVDLRPESGTISGINETPNTKGFPGTQNLDIYTFFAFGSGAQLMKDVAKYGGFEDSNGNNIPDLASEWDADGDGLPDTYYESTNASNIKTKLLEAIIDILQKSASGTSLSVLATSSDGEGAVYQSFFYPSVNEGSGERTWLGNLYGLFLDPFGNIREDTNQDGKLVLTQDYILRTYYDTTTKVTTMQQFLDADGDGKADSATPAATVALGDVKAVWDGGKRLALTATSDRKIYTWLDIDHDGFGTGDTFSDTHFVDTTSAAATLRPYLNASTDSEAQDIIKFIRGDEPAGMRPRKISVEGSDKVWKLGDIVYSTPTVVAAPRERYDLLYGDETYRQYYEANKDRRHVVYVGANDGMLHAFDAGTYEAANGTHYGKFTPRTGKALGDELWAFIPYELLPHLKWLTMTNYTHVYYVDLTPKITDVKLWPETGDTAHPGGWGTILIGGMRMGGKDITLTDTGFSAPTSRTFKSAYFVLDITNPETPVFLKSFTDSQLGFTTSIPSVVRVPLDPANPKGDANWFIVVGSGPTTYDSTSTQNGYVKIFKLNDGTIQTIDTGKSNSFLGDPVNVDANLDYTSDVIYIGNSFVANSEWKGDMFRINIGNASDPKDSSTWILSTLFSRGSGANKPGPITAPANVTLGTAGDLWVYFGTGRYLTTADESDASQQRFYGIKDPCWVTVCTTTYNDGATTLRATALIEIDTDGVVTNAGTDTNFNDLITTSNALQGWYIDLQAKERVITKNTVLGGIVFFTTFVPDGDVCAVGGDSFIYGVYFETGTSFKESSFGDAPPVTGDPPEEIVHRKDLGEGLPSAIGIHMGRPNGGNCSSGISGFVQQSTGAVTQICGDPAFSVRSGMKGFRDF